MSQNDITGKPLVSENDSSVKKAPHGRSGRSFSGGQKAHPKPPQTSDESKLALGRRYNRTKKAHGGDRTPSTQNEDLPKQQTPDAFRLALGRRYNRTKQKHGGQLPNKGSAQFEHLKPQMININRQ